MEHINILAETSIKIEEVKPEPIDFKEELFWNSIEEDEFGPFQCSFETENNAEEELEQPVAVFVEPVKMHEHSCTLKEEMDPLSPSAEDSSFTVVKQEGVLTSSDGINSQAGKSREMQKQESKLQHCSINRKNSTSERNYRVEQVDKCMLMNTEKEHFKCLFCGKSFSGRGNLRRHVLLHTDEPSFQCTVCENRFSAKWHLQSHMRIHSGEKPFLCTICKKSFREKGTLNTHMYIHTGENPYECILCKKRFNQRGNRLRHIRTHHKEKLFCSIDHVEKHFHCKVCEKRYVYKRDLQAHMTIHTGEKPFQCAICTKSFSQKRVLRRHIQEKHAQEKPFKCTVCNKRFTRKTTVRKHMNVHTGDKT